jgi:hypothetical protein
VLQSPASSGFVRRGSVRNRGGRLLNTESSLSKSKKANGGRLLQHDKNVGKKASVGGIVVKQNSNERKGDYRTGKGRRRDNY